MYIATTELEKTSLQKNLENHQYKYVGERFVDEKPWTVYAKDRTSHLPIVAIGPDNQFFTATIPEKDFEIYELIKQPEQEKAFARSMFAKLISNYQEATQSLPIRPSIVHGAIGFISASVLGVVSQYSSQTDVLSSLSMDERALYYGLAGTATALISIAIRKQGQENKLEKLIETYTIRQGEEAMHYLMHEIDAGSS